MRLRALSVLLIVAAAGLIVPVPVAAQATQTLTETFEDDTPLLTPTADWYTAASVGTGQMAVRTENANSGNNSLRVSSGQSSGIKLALDGGDMTCGNNNGVSLHFWLKAAAAPGGDAYFVGFADQDQVTGGGSSPREFLGIKVDDVQGLVALAGSGSTNSQSSAWVTNANIAATGMFDVNVYLTNCASGIGVITSVVLDKTFSFETVGSYSAIDAFIYYVPANACTCPNIWVDDISFQNIPIPPTPPPTVTGEGAITVDGLSGFAIDASGSVILTRQTGAAAVISYDASTLQSYGSDATGFCNTNEGVATYLLTIFYTKCSGGTDIDVIAVRDPDFSETVKPSGSSGLCNSDYDETDDGFGDQFQVPNTLQDLHTLDFYFLLTTGTTSCTSAWTYSLTGGKIGVTAITRNAGNTNDNSDSTEVQFSSQVPDDTCFWRASDQEDYLGAVREDSATSVYRVTVDVRQGIDPAQSPNAWTADTGMERVFHSVGNYGLSRGISCTEGMMAVQNADGDVYVVQVVAETGLPAGTVIAQFSGGGAAPARSVALSIDGKWIAYHAGSTTWEIGCVKECGGGIASGTVVGSITAPTGAFKAVALDPIGTSAWIATNTNIERFVVQTVTCQDNCTSIVTDGAGRIIDTGGGGGGSTGTGAFADTQASFADALGTTQLLAGLFGLSILMVAMAVHGAKALPESRVIGGAGGALIGLILGVSLGFVGLEWIFILVVLAMAALLFYWHRGN